MKYVHSFLFILFSLLFLNACSEPVTPAQVAEAFLTELADGDLEDAKRYASAETLKILEIAEKFGQLPTQDKFKFILVEEKIIGDTATVIYTNYKGKNKPIKLKKIDGKWKVHESKR